MTTTPETEFRKGSVYDNYDLSAKVRRLEQALADLCLRVSQNHEAHEKALTALKVDQNQDAERISKLERKGDDMTVMMGDTRTDVLNIDGRARVLQGKVEQIDTVLDRDTGMLLSSLCKRVANLENRHYGETDRKAEAKRAPHGVSPDGVIHNFASVDSLGPATVTLDPLADSRGLSVCIDGHNMRGHFLIIPWEAIDKKRMAGVKAKTQQAQGDPLRPWWRQ